MKNKITAFLSFLQIPVWLLFVNPAYAASLCPTDANFANLCNLKIDNNTNVVGNIVNILLVVAVVLALIYLIYGGIRYIISGGDKAKIDAARSHIIGAIVGLIIALLAFFIVNIVLFLITGKTFSTFNVPTLF